MILFKLHERLIFIFEKHCCPDVLYQKKSLPLPEFFRSAWIRFGMIGCELNMFRTNTKNPRVS
jgi:hypothetical protein